jgi:hypothetical protein
MQLESSVQGDECRPGRDELIENVTALLRALAPTSAVRADIHPRGVLFIVTTPDPIARGRVLGRNQRQLEALRRILTSLSAIHGLGAQIAVR